MQLPAELRAAIALALEGVSRNELSERAMRISQYYRAGSASAASLRDHLDALAYAVSRMPATYAATRNALGRLEERCPDFTPRSVIDVGAGAGAASWAAAEIWPPVETITQVDASAVLMELGVKLAASSSSAALRGARRIIADIAKEISPAAPADLLILAYTLAELTPRQMERALDSAWSACAGVLAIVEPGTPSGYARVLAARNLLLASGGRILAPCPHELTCPLAPPDWCHFAQRVARSRDHMLLKSAELPYEDEKFSYLIAVREPLFRTPEKDRILAPPQTGKTAIEFKLCKRDGSAAPASIARRDAAAFKQARKKNWGDEL